MSKKTITKLCRTAFICATTLWGTTIADTIYLSADKATEFAQKQSLTVKSSELNNQIQKKSVQSARASFLPVLNGTAGYTRMVKTPDVGGASVDTSLMNILYNPSADPTDKKILSGILGMFSGMGSSLSTPDNLWSLGFTVGQPIFAGGRIANAYRIAKLSDEAQETTHKRTLTDIGYNARKMYWNYVALMKSVESIHEAQAWLADLSSMQKKMYENQMMIELDLLNTKIQIDNNSLIELKTKNAIKTFGDQMLLFLGLPTGSDIEVDTSELAKALEAFTPPSEDEINKLLDDREEIKILKNKIETLKLAKKIQYGSYLPTVSGFLNNSFSNQYSADELKHTTTAGVSLNWSIFDWGKNYREAQKSDIQIQQLELTYNNTRDQLRLKVLSLARTVDESRKALEIAQSDMETATKALDISKLKYDAQAITNTDLLNSRTLLTSKSVAFTQARISSILALEEYRIVPSN